MSYRVIIADDEPKIIQLIKMLGNWDEYGIEIVDECHDGRETLRSIYKNKPDFVISDIKMPELDGIELIEETRKAGIDSFFILLSGYRHFEYAQSAIALNVVEYLLKPIDQEKLNQTLGKVCRQISQKREEKINREELTRIREQESIRQIKRMMSRMMEAEKKGSMPEEFLSEAALNAAYQTAFAPGRYQILNIATNMGNVLENANSLLHSELLRLLENCFSGKAVYYYYSNVIGYVILLNYREEFEKQMKECISALYYGLRNLTEIYGDFRINIGVSSVKSSCWELAAAAQEARAAEWGRLLMTRDGVLDYSRVSHLKRIPRQEMISDEELSALENYVRYLGKEEMGELFQKLHSRAGAWTDASPESMAEVFYALLSSVESAVNEEERDKLDEACMYAYVEARSFPGAIKNLYMKLEEYISQKREIMKEKTRKPISEAVRYIKVNYGKNISAEDVAAASQVSAVYLSRLFKDEMDMGFNEFLTQVRLEEARKLLAGTNLTIKEIAGKVGYLDEKYFSKLFKKVTGIKPTEYRRIYG